MSTSSLTTSCSSKRSIFGAGPDPADEKDLIIAKELVRQRFIVGLMDEMVESIRRFNIVLGVDESSERSQQCMEDFGLLAPKDVTPASPVVAEGADGEAKTHATDKNNSNKHPKFVEGDPEFDAIAARNPLDMILYKYILQLFEDQKLIIDSYFPHSSFRNQPLEIDSSAEI